MPRPANRSPESHELEITSQVGFVKLKLAVTGPTEKMDGACEDGLLAGGGGDVGLVVGLVVGLNNTLNDKSSWSDQLPVLQGNADDT